MFGKLFSLFSRNRISRNRKTLEEQAAPPSTSRVNTKEDVRALDWDWVQSAYPLPATFSRDLLQEAEACRNRSASEILTRQRREDLRTYLLVTIDGADAKDLDDAVSLRPLTKGGVELGVHIADVSHYVAKGSLLDQEAYARGNSVYFIDRVLPMFPEVLSNDLCSLNARTDKAAVSILMHVTSSGECVDYRITESLIQVHTRLSYAEVQAHLDGKRALPDKKIGFLVDSLDSMAKTMRARRLRTGGVDLSFVEQKFYMAENGQVADIQIHRQNDAEKLIEECMLLANQQVGAFLHAKGQGIYRVHGSPSEERVAEMAQVANRLGYNLMPDIFRDAVALTKFLSQLDNEGHHRLFQHMTLRAMAQACYRNQDIGHFGLGFEFYTHFTSPIRRYADLVAHRLIKHALYSEDTYTADVLQTISEHVSVQERRALDAERAFLSRKSARFIEDYVGEQFDGFVTGVLDFGFFVQLAANGVEGLIRYASMDDYFVYHEGMYRARGRRSGNMITVGDHVSVRVEKVNVIKGFIDFAFLHSFVEGWKELAPRNPVARRPRRRRPAKPKEL